MINGDVIFKEEVELFNNIELDTITIKTPNIKEIDIRFNNKICLNQDDNYKFICSNKIVEGEDYCSYCIPDETVDSFGNIVDESLRNKYLIEELNYYKNNERLILEDIYEHLNEMEIIKKNNEDFINKYKKEKNKNYEFTFPSKKYNHELSNNECIKYIKDNTYVNI